MPDTQCCDPDAPQVPCANCGKTVFTCERDVAVDDSLLCPLHPDGLQDIDGLWFCSGECWNDYWDRYVEREAKMADEKAILSWEQADQIIQDQRAEIAQLKEAIIRLADHDATITFIDGDVLVTMDATLTDEEREAVEAAVMSLDGTQHLLDHLKRARQAATLRCLLERLK